MGDRPRESISADFGACQGDEASARRPGAGAGARRGVIAGALVFVALNVLVVALEPLWLRLAAYNRQYTVARLSDYHRSPRPDVVFMGTSRVVSGLDPAVAESELAAAGMPIRALNLGITGSPIEGNYVVLKNVISAGKRPDLVVYGLTENEVHRAFPPALTLPYVHTILRPSDAELLSGAGAVATGKFWLRQLVPLYRDRELIHDAFSILVNPGDPSHGYLWPGPRRWKPPANGFYPPPRDAKVDLARVTAEQRHYLDNFRFSADRLHCLVRFVRLAKKRGMQIALVNMPVTAAHRSLWQRPAEIQTYREKVAKIARRTGTPLLDLYENPAGAIPETAFLDTHHLHVEGAAALTRLVARHLLVEHFAARAPPSRGRASGGPGESRARAPTDALQLSEAAHAVQ